MFMFTSCDENPKDGPLIGGTVNCEECSVQFFKGISGTLFQGMGVQGTHFWGGGGGLLGTVIQGGI